MTELETLRIMKSELLNHRKWLDERIERLNLSIGEAVNAEENRQKQANFRNKAEGGR